MRRRIAVVAVAAALAGVGLTLPAQAHDEPCPAGTVLELNLHVNVEAPEAGAQGVDEQICLPPAGEAPAPPEIPVPTP